MWWGLAAQGAGTGMEAIGNAQGASAIEAAWRKALGRQDEADSAVDARTMSFLDSLSPDVLAGTGRTNEVAARLHGSSQAVGKAIKARAARGGRNKLPAGGEQKLADILRNQQGMDAIEARGGGFGAGVQDISNMSRAFQGDRSRITRDAALWQTLLPYELRTAGTAGGVMRGLGQGLQMGGQAATNWAMSQPHSEAPPNQLASTPGVAGVQPAQPQWQQPAQWQMGQSMQPTYMDLFGGRR
jgi:hypothetical protein